MKTSLTNLTKTLKQALEMKRRQRETQRRPRPQAPGACTCNPGLRAPAGTASSGRNPCTQEREMVLAPKQALGLEVLIEFSIKY